MPELPVPLPLDGPAGVPFRELVQRSPDNFAVLDASLVIRYESPSVTDILGWESSELVGRSVLDLVHPEDVDPTLSAATALKDRSGATIAHGLRIRHKDGHYRHLDVSVRNALDEPAVAGFVISARDVSDRVRAEESLRRRNLVLTALHETALGLVETVDLDSVLETIVTRAARLVRSPYAGIWLPASGRTGLVLAHALELDDELRVGRRVEAGEGVAGKVFATGEPLVVNDYQSWEHRIPGVGWTACAGIPVTTGGQPVAVLFVASRDPGRTFGHDEVELLGRFAQLAAIAVANARLVSGLRREVEERRHAEESLRELAEGLEHRVAERTGELATANAELARAARTKDEFLASMSHELRTPLNAILGMAEALLEKVHGPLTERQTRMLRILEESGRHLLELINDVLDLSKIEAGRLEVLPEPVSVDGLCEGSLRLVRSDAHRKRITLRGTFDPDARWVRGDPRRLKQVLVNLLSNAVKFTPEGGEVSLEVVRDAAADAIRFRVRDTGIGIRAEDLPLLFRPFVQLDSGLSRSQGGTGLGLALVRRLTEAHGGGVTVESTPGKGSCFTVSLPYEPGFVPLRPREEPAPLPRPADEPARASGPAILLAEDNEANVATVASYLEAKGYRVTVARTGLSALALASSLRPAAVVMDIQMPGLDGLEVTRRLRADAALRDVPVIALTALAMPGDRERCLAAGADAFLPKPVALRELVATIAALVSRRPEEPLSSPPP